MTRVLFWNIEKFRKNKIEDPSISASVGTKKRRVDPNQASTALKAADRFTVIKRIILATNPDIVVIVELSSEKSPTPQMDSGGTGVAGAKVLLTWLRGLSAEWRLVPPLKVGDDPKTEAVGVFYKGQTGTLQRFFTGPNFWTGGLGGFSCVPTYAPTPGAYDAGDVNMMLVPPGSAPRQVPPGAAYCGGQMENTLAARVTFRELGNPDFVLNYGIYRPPYMVTFTEQNATGIVRNLTVFGVHTPPKDGTYSEGYPAYLADTEEVTGDLRALETRIIGGDFNLPLLKTNGTQTNLYAPLTVNDYTLLLTSLFPNAQMDRTGQGFYMTSLRRGKSTIWQYSYPGYDYFSQSYDNILVRPFNPAQVYATTVMNPVVGTPYQGNPNGTAGAPVLGSLMQAPIVDPWPAALLDPPENQQKYLCVWNNFGHLRSTSDHFGVFADV